ncbi:pantoate--beta-alanine ligase [Arthrobacter sp. JZ12]|uniref:pantoate--beta-alanine ligase n=1 Tax=Arthrobacter sp. JZ12 TaxID=2654190 RepID=UPI002B46B1C2|nr:pantoate--beta-alanine ligase [Arthrobacter sp. JZ12]WRH23752.1 pantoate--beta-alanine ligase [Arthrobacter sp. JZ12]
MSPRVVTTATELRAAIVNLLAAAGPGETSLGLVPTMGALHAGHAALARTAREENDVVVATIFVNPLQFGDPSDLDRYPRTLDDDVELLGRHGVDLVFAPSREEIYPAGDPLVRLSAGRLGEKYEGEFRPGHFDGMLTVVAKLLHLGWPAADARYRAYFGQKDAQQLALIRRMVQDLNFAVDIRAVPTVRSAEGLALSSRNRFLSPEEAEAALVLSRSLRLLQERAERREPLDVDSAVALVRSQPLVNLEYFEVVDPATLEPLAFNCRETPFTGEALALVAARVGSVRLIDNQPLEAGLHN